MEQFRFGPDSNKEAVRDFESALKLDPNLVRAKVELSAALSDRVTFGWSADPRGEAARAETLIDEALAAEPDNAVAHLVKALAYQTVIISKRRTPAEPLWEAGSPKLRRRRASIAISPPRMRLALIGGFSLGALQKGSQDWKRQ